jgi:hypothetical protein
MALDKTTLKNSIKSAFQAAVGSEDAEEEIATALANAIDAFVKTGKATGSDVPSGDTHNLSIS